MSTNQRCDPTKGPTTRPTRRARIAIRALLQAATPGPTGRRPWGETPLEMAQREAAAAGVLPEEGDGLAANARMMGRLQSGWRVFFVGIWLLYLIDTVKDAWHAPDPIWRFAGTAAILAFCVLYVGVFLSLRRFRADLRAEPSRVTSWGVLGLAVGLILVAGAAAGESALAMCVYLAVLTMFLLPVRQGGPLVVLNSGLVALLSNLVPGWKQADLLSFQILITGLAIWGILQLVQRNNQLAQAREEITSLAVSEERLRFSRDLHDILGHSLTVITLKAELAGRLVHADPVRAEQEIAEVEQLARTALADVRTTAAGYRNLTLAAELASARTALDTAGIEAELSGAVDDVPVERLELFGWAVREGVTNVVRHSGARHCRVTVDRGHVEITDDGTGPGRSRVGNGLTGLRERAEAAGAHVLIDAAEHGGFRLRVGW